MKIGFITSIVLSLFAMVGIINAFNLIDGIDGLASGIAIMAATIFGVWFYLAGHIQFSIMSFALVGSVTGFFLYNVFGNKNKLFMGDTGSLIIGIVISTLVIKFNEFNIVKSTSFAIDTAPVISFAIIIVPLIDTLRVMTIRIMNGKSAFIADNNHIHHRLLLLTPSHLKVTLLIVFINIIIVAFAFFLNSISLNPTIQLLLIFLIGLTFSLLPSLILKFKLNKKVKLPQISTHYS
ncbi:MAG: undecaprenyl/decaprenyl-phosphate alpha-N-acetylglucosaminyl 1-phosphate transferase [Bacteroidetes bacterium]|nr:undecaprenyl/decaprenyl-phosphate alpha-N-acetylglucosaminyl 1-phosphate transferase [Bacteroidota bacterium]